MKRYMFFSFQFKFPFGFLYLSKGVFLLVLLTLCVTACSSSSQKPYGDLKREDFLLFQSGFEGDTKLVPYGKSNCKIVGRDDLLMKSDWEHDLTGVINNVYINFTKGDTTQRFVKIVEDPVNSANKVLLYHIKEPWQTGPEEKARIQIEFYQIQQGLKEYVQSMKMFISEDFSRLRHFPEKITWFTITEIWNDVAWKKDINTGARVTLGLCKPVKGEGDFYFKVDQQDHDWARLPEYPFVTNWVYMNEKIKVPIGEWFTLEYYFKEGDKNTGRFYMTIQKEGQDKQLVFDITNLTHNSKATQPDGVTEFNPLKMYTSKDVANYMKEHNRALQIYWDDLKLWGKR